MVWILPMTVHQWPLLECIGKGQKQGELTMFLCMNIAGDCPPLILYALFFIEIYGKRRKTGNWRVFISINIAGDSSLMAHYALLECIGKEGKQGIKEYLSAWTLLVSGLVSNDSLCFIGIYRKRRNYWGNWRVSISIKGVRRRGRE